MDHPLPRPPNEDAGEDDPVVLFQGAHRDLELTGKPDDTTKDAVKKLLDDTLESGLGGDG